MEIDLNRIALLDSNLEFTINHASQLYSDITVNVVAPPDNEYPQLDVDTLKNSSKNLVKNLRNLYDKIKVLKENIKNVENENSIIVEKLGDTLDVKEGLQYFETGLGTGNSGTISTDGIRPENAEYVVDRIAIYADGILIDNIGETGTNVEQCIMDYEKQYGDIEISYHISMIGENGSHNATGWLDREQVAEGSLVGIDRINLEDAFKEIEEKYENYTEPVLETVKKDEITADNIGVMAGIVSDLKSTQKTTPEPVPLPTVYNQVYIHVTGSSYDKYYASLDLEGKTIAELKPGDFITEICGERTQTHTVSKVNKLDNGDYELVFSYGNARCTISVPEPTPIEEEYVNSAKRDDIITTTAAETTATTTTTSSVSSPQTTTTVATTTTATTGGTTTATTTTRKPGIDLGSGTTTTTVAPKPPTKYGISLQSNGEATDCIYFDGNISDLKKGSKFYLSNNKEKKVESIEDTGTEYKITYRGPFGGWEQIYIKKG